MNREKLVPYGIAIAFILVVIVILALVGAPMIEMIRTHLGI